MNNQFEPLDNGEVLSVDESALVLIGHRTFRVGEFSEALRVQLEGYVSGWTKDKDAWFSEEGIPCEVLRFSSQGWQKGKVRVRLEFCQQDFEDQNKEASLSLGDPIHLPPPTSSSQELDLEESGISSASFDNELAAAALTGGLATAALADNSLPDEFSLETPASSNWALEDEEQSTIYTQMEQETSTFIADDEFDTSQMQNPLDEDFDLGEISDSIEQELELVETPLASDDELLDLGNMSTDSDEDFVFGDMSADSKDNLEFGDLSSSDRDEFQFEDISLGDELGESETNSLLDDVWQDINEGSWQNNH